MNKVIVKIIKKNADNIPVYATKDSAGADLKAEIVDELKLYPGESILVPTGIFLEIPKGFEAQIRPRSGLALKHSITVLNTPGTVDADFRGEIKVILINHSKEIFTILPKMRIGQIIFAPIYQAEFIECRKLSLSSRGEGGFGHSGTH